MANNTATHLKQLQRPHVPGRHHAPFLAEPADFGSPRTRGELDASQTGQIILTPAPKRTPSIFDLAEVIGSAQVDEITRDGQIVFHSVGDTGAGKHDDLGEVAQVMAMDYFRPNPADRPAFFLHLGDVVYNLQYQTPESKAKMYQPQFYEPYATYPGKILAIPGNHDSNPQEDPRSIDAFQDNFCAPPPAAGKHLAALLETPGRAPMYQPGVYYRLTAPFVDILALFSNGGEKEGVIKGDVAGNAQWDFLVEQLTAIAAARRADPTSRKALLVAVHHPPFSGGGGHVGSSHMLKDLDDAFQAGGVSPDAILSGHSHVYERFTRTVPVDDRLMPVPYIVAGNGGHGITPLKPTFERTPVETPLRGRAADGSSDHSLQQYFNGFGHLLITATRHVLTIDLIGTHTGTHQAVDSVTVQLAADFADNLIAHETPSFEHPAVGEEEAHHTRRPLA